MISAPVMEEKGELEQVDLEEDPYKV